VPVRVLTYTTPATAKRIAAEPLEAIRAQATAVTVPKAATSAVVGAGNDAPESVLS
jgi:hypothetical protein